VSEETEDLRMARFLIRQRGEDAAEFARGCAEAHAAIGETEGATLWQRIAQAIRAMQVAPRSAGRH
jgi:hypothetical protein